MARKTEERRQELREALIIIAERTITNDGVTALRARDLAKEAGCAVGAIYNVFGDLNELILVVNGRTFHRLGAAVADALQDAPEDPVEQLVVMAQAYHHFAAYNPRAWRAIFSVRRDSSDDDPDWYQQELELLFGYISRPLARAFADRGADDIVLLTKALFSCVHGIVLLGLNEGRAGVSTDKLDHMLAVVLRQFAAGLEKN